MSPHPIVLGAIAHDHVRPRRAPSRPPGTPGMTRPRHQALQLVVAAAFLLIGLLALRDWWRGGERRRGYLALALG